MRGILVLTITSIFLMAMFGCSGSSDVVIPEDNQAAIESVDNHNLWGLWQFSGDPISRTLDVYELRLGDIHLNALKFLEPPVNMYLTVENIQFNGNVLDLDVVLRHPFLGLPQYTGFDVSGILIAHGSTTGFSDPDLRMPGDGDIRLLNPDGYTRWWNPVEFPHVETVLGYKDGLLGTPDDIADYDATLNGYKFFCDALDDPDDMLDTVDPASRCEFSSGMSNSRHYTIEFGSSLVFNYAIDASWKMPVGDPPWDVPESFPPDANRPEAWNIVVTEDDNTLWNDDANIPPSGGGLMLSVDVWDHFDAGLNSVTVESPGNFNAVTATTPSGGGAGYSTYQLDILNATPSPEEIELLITVESESVGYQGLLAGKTVSAYFTHTSLVDDEAPNLEEECGVGIYSSVTNTPFQDHPGNLVKYELAWLTSGPYEGEMLVLAGSGKIGRYNMDMIANPDGEIFCELPPGAITVGANAGYVFHLEVERITGRVLTVGNGPNGANNAILIYNDNGVLLSDETQLSVGPNGRKIQAMDIDENGDLWMLTGTAWASYTKDVKLERWIYQTDSPYYVYDPTSDLEAGSALGKWLPDPNEFYVVENDIAGMIISHAADRMFIFQQAHIGEHNGHLYVWDLNSSGPPTYRDDLYNDSLFSYGTQRGFNDNHKNAYGGIWIDRSVPELDYCRILIYGRRCPGIAVMLIRLDATDCSITNENVIEGIGSPYTLGINEDPDPAKRNVVFVNYPSSSCWMGQPPVDW